MLTTILRAMWKDWGFAPSLFSHAKDFLGLAKKSTGRVQEGFVRAAIIFSLMSFEAYWRDVIRGYIQTNRRSIDPSKLLKVEKELNTSRIGIHEALNNWPKVLTGKPLDTATKSFGNFVNFKEYRNLLVHGKITDKVPSGKLAQDVETISEAELALQTVSEVIKIVAVHFGFSVPTWA
jgi:hypothetical protein